jgi:hypothetical protein
MRVNRALRIENKDSILSVIIDGMDQNHCRIPYLQQTTFSKPITQHLTGALVHGHGKILNFILLFYLYL